MSVSRFPSTVHHVRAQPGSLRSHRELHAPHRSAHSDVPLLRRHGVRVLIALSAVYLIWGSTYIAIDVALRTVPPMTLMAIRFAIAGVALYIWASSRGALRGARPTLRQWRSAVLTGAVMLVGGTGLAAVGIKMTGVSTAALLSATVPVWLALFARLIYGEALSGRAWVGLSIGLVGVGVLVDPSGGKMVGMLVVILGAIAWAIGSLHSRRATGPARTLVAAAIEMLGGAILFSIVAVLTGEFAAFEFRSVGASTWLAVGYLTTAGSLVAFVAYRWLLANVSTLVVGTHAYVNPIVAVLLAWLLLDDRLTVRSAVAGSIILISVMVMVTSRPEVPIPAQITSGGDVFAGDSRWRRMGLRFGRFNPMAEGRFVASALPYRPLASSGTRSLARSEVRRRTPRASRSLTSRRTHGYLTRHE